MLLFLCTVCTECMDSSTAICYLCDNSFDVDELQKFQPGFVLEWRSNLKVSTTTNEVPVTDESFVPATELVIRPSQERRRTNKQGDGHTCEYDPFALDGRCIHCWEEHNFCCLLNDRSRCNICHRVAEECPNDESKSFFLSRRLIELNRQSPPLDRKRPLKVIVFSQFRAALNFIGDRLLRRFGTACVAEYFGSHRKQELHKFTYEQCCFCLLLTKDGSEGLDLSFVTNVIFLEEVFDKSLEDQVVARAWRMGASGCVAIETLIAKNTIEEVIGDQMQSRYDEGEGKRSTSTNGDQQRLKTLLQSLRFITDHHSALQSTTSTSTERIAVKEEKINTLKRLSSHTQLGESAVRPSKRKCHTVRFA
jgi:Helicase conserved C-terminal domain